MELKTMRRFFGNRLIFVGVLLSLTDSSGAFSANLAPNLLFAKGLVSFESVAPLEVIQAKSLDLTGVLDLDKATFAFSLLVQTFEGFNSPLQKEHFNEHYLETKLFPKSTFTGNLIGLENCTKKCDMELLAKGKFTIHGITNVLVIPVNFHRNGSEVSANCDFDIKLEDFGIKMPKILEAKIAPAVAVHVEIEFNEEKK